MDALRRTAAKLGSHGQLNAAMVQQKNAISAAKVALGADVRAASLLVEWVRNEDNPALRDVFGKMSDLWRVQEQLDKQLLHQRAAFHRVLREILSEARQLDMVKKYLGQWKSKAQRLRRQAEASRRKQDVPRTRALEDELEQVKETVRQAELEVASCAYDFEMFKAARLRSGLTALTVARMEHGERARVVFEAQQALAAEIPADPPQYTKRPVYTMGPDKTDMIVCRAVCSLDMHELFANELGSVPVPVLDDTGGLPGSALLPPPGGNTSTSTSTSAPSPQGKLFAAERSYLPRVHSITPSEEGMCDALDMLSAEGEVIPREEMACRPNMPGVTIRGAPLLGSIALRRVAQRSFNRRHGVRQGPTRHSPERTADEDTERPPTPPQRRPSGTDLPGYVAPNARRHTQLYETPVSALFDEEEDEEDGPEEEDNGAGEDKAAPTGTRLHSRDTPSVRLRKYTANPHMAISSEDMIAPLPGRGRHGSSGGDGGVRHSHRYVDLLGLADLEAEQAMDAAVVAEDEAADDEDREQRDTARPVRTAPAAASAAASAAVTAAVPPPLPPPRPPRPTPDAAAGTRDASRTKERRPAPPVPRRDSGGTKPVVRPRRPSTGPRAVKNCVAKNCAAKASAPGSAKGAKAGEAASTTAPTVPAAASTATPDNRTDECLYGVPIELADVLRPTLLGGPDGGDLICDGEGDDADEDGGDDGAEPAGAERPVVLRQQLWRLATGHAQTIKQEPSEAP